MELNLYGISSIKLDKMKKRQIRRFLIAWGIVYLITIIVATQFPKALDVSTYQAKSSNDEQVSKLEFRECINLLKEQHDYFDMTANVKIELKKQLDKEQKLILKYNVSMQTTENPQLSQQCNAPLSQDSLAVLKKPQDKLTWNPVINNHLKNRTLNCEQLADLQYQCSDVPIAQGDYDEIMQNNFIYVNTNANQEIYQVQEITFFLKMRNLDHTKSLTQMKYFFVIVGLFTLFYYYRAISHFQMDDLGLIQKWVFVLLVQLLFFDDPFYAARNIFPYSSYSIIQALCQATFLSMILFFWLVVVHSISSNEVINIDERRFYLPKVVLCLCIWVVMMLSSGYLNLQQISDPSFYWRDDIGSFYSTMQILTVILFFLYSTYFVIVAYVAFFQIKEMKKSYKFSLYMTFGVIFISISIIILNSYRPVSNDTVMYVSFYSLMNIYMFIIAYLYSPSVDSLEDLQFKQTRKEHEHIMNQFYEQELPDISKEMDSSREVLNKDRKKSKNGVEKRRYMKKDPEQKAKDKLWESIIKETEDEDESSSDEDHQI